MVEADMQRFWGHYLEKQPPRDTEVYELKIAKATSLSFDAIKPHQIEALQACETSKGLYHKLTDPPVFYGMNTRFNRKRPFDCMHIVLAKAFIVVWFYKPRKPKIFIKIKLKDFLRMQKEQEGIRKSFTEAMALSYAYSIVKLKEAREIVMIKDYKRYL